MPYGDFPVPREPITSMPVQSGADSVFYNIEHVASPTPVLHRTLLAALDLRPEDEVPSNAPNVQGQLDWLNKMVSLDINHRWKQRQLAMLVGTRT